MPDGSDADAAVLRLLERIDGRRFRDDRGLTLEEVSGTDSLRVNSRHGIIYIMRGGLPPLDCETVSAQADTTN